MAKIFFLMVFLIRTDNDVVLYCIVLYCIVLYCVVLYCVVLCCIVLCCIVLCCIVLVDICVVLTALSVMNTLIPRFSSFSKYIASPQE
jgi:hypothetical protein